MPVRGRSPKDLAPLVLDLLLPDPVFVFEHSGRIVDVNTRACESLGYTRAELLALSVGDIEDGLNFADVQKAWENMVVGSTTIISRHQRRKDASVFPVELRLRVLESEGERLYLATAIDTTDRTEAEMLLREDLAQVRSVFGAMAEGLVLQLPDGRIVDANPAAEAILGLNRQQLLGMSAMDSAWCSIREDGSTYPAVEHPAMVTVRTGMPMRDQIVGVVNPASGPRWISINSQPIRAAGSSAPTAVVVTFVDVTRQRRLTEQLRSAEADLRAIVDNIPAPIAIVDHNLRYRFVNRVYSDWFGADLAQMIGVAVQDFHGGAVFAGFRDLLRDALSGRTVTGERDLRSRQGLRHCQVVLVPRRDSSGAVTGVIVVNTDVTERKEREQQTQRLNLELQDRVRERSAKLQEREVLLQETHHRVKNNLQIIASLINMQRRSMSDAISRHALAECHSRVQAMALIHQSLYEYSDLSQVPFSQYVEALVRNIFHAIDPPDLDVDLSLDLDPLSLPLQQAIPCGLIINELITNALKHAFRGRTKGALRVAVRNSDSAVDISVGDDGVGMGTKGQPGYGHLGLQLVTVLVAQLAGQLEVVDSHGTEVRVRFRTEPVSV